MTDNIPEHIALVMDGNGTWAENKGLPRLNGHKAGTDALKKIIETVQKSGIKFLTVYAFSTENWNRSKTEVDGLMNMLRDYLQSDDITKLDNEDVKITMCGNKNDGRIPSDILSMIDDVEKRTENNSTFHFNIAFNYGGRDEIINAIKSMSAKDISSLSEDNFAKHLYIPELPAPDLIIRTGGQTRTSNFLLWQSAYSEYIFTDTLWPDFDKKELDKSLEEYSKRKRKFGKV